MSVLEHDRFIAGYWHSAGSQYAWGCADGVTIRRMALDGTVTNRGALTSIEALLYVDCIFSTSDPDVIFALAQKNNFYRVLRSDDGGQTFAQVLLLGEGIDTAGAQATYVKTLRDRGFLELSVNAPGAGGLIAGTMLIAEYNIASGRVAGGVNDAVRVYTSTDGGLTWATIWTLNADGVNNIGHIHAVRQHPTTGHIYFLCGDADNKAAIVRWDGAAELPDNTSPPSMSRPGVEVATGGQKHRAVDILFTASAAVTMSDTNRQANPSGDGSGIWKWSLDLSESVRVNNDTWNYDDMHVGWHAVQTGNKMFFTTAAEHVDASNTWDTPNLLIYNSDDGGEAWSAIASFNCRENAAEWKSYQGVFLFGGKIYLSSPHGAGHGVGTVALEITTEPQLDHVRTIAPVYYVGQWTAAGSDANNGRDKTAPFGTLKYAVESSRICRGARIRVGVGDIQQDNMYPIWSSPTVQGVGAVTIEGLGRTASIVSLRAASGGTYAIYTEASRVSDIIFRKMTIRALKTAIVLNINASSKLFFYDAIIGDESTSVSACAQVTSAQLHVHRTLIRQPSTSVPAVIMASGSFFGVRSKIIGGESGIRQQSSAVVDMIKCLLADFALYGLSVVSGATVIPKAKDCIFYSTRANTSGINDAVGLTETDANIDYNSYFCTFAATANVANSGGSHSVTTDPLFVDAVNYRLATSSPCIGAGSTGGGVDYDGLAYLTQDIGPSRYKPTGTGFGEWTPFDASMPPLSLASTAPGSLLEVQEWSKANVTKKQIDKVHR